MKLKCSSIFKTYHISETRDVINDLSFELDTGNSLALYGPSGVGKSTLLNILSGLDNPDRGEIFYNDICFTDLSDTEKISFRLEHISHVFQTPNLLQDFNVIENIMLPMRYKGISKKKSRDIAMGCLEEVGCQEHATSSVTTLSGGEAQRVGIARAMAKSSKIIFADEPTGNLDNENSKVVIDNLINICKTKSITLVVVTHDENIISKTSNSMKMLDGKIT